MSSSLQTQAHPQKAEKRTFPLSKGNVPAELWAVGMLQVTQLKASPLRLATVTDSFTHTATYDVGYKLDKEHSHDTISDV